MTYADISFDNAPARQRWSLLQWTDLMPLLHERRSAADTDRARRDFKYAHGKLQARVVWEPGKAKAGKPGSRPRPMGR